MWNFLLDLVGTDSTPELGVNVTSNIDTPSLCLGLLIGAIFGVMLTLLVICTIKVIKEDNKNNTENTNDKQG